MCVYVYVCMLCSSFRPQRWLWDSFNDASYSTRLMKKINRNPVKAHLWRVVHCFNCRSLFCLTRVFGKCFCFVFVSDFLPAPAKNSATFNCAFSCIFVLLYLVILHGSSIFTRASAFCLALLLRRS